MPFHFERILPSGDVIDSQIHKKALSEYGGGALGRRVVDKDKNAVLYCLSIGRDLSRPPGNYLFFFHDKMARIRAHLHYKELDNSNIEAIYTVYSVEFEDDLNHKIDLSDAMGDLRGAFETYGYSYPTTPKKVSVEFKKGIVTKSCH